MASVTQRYVNQLVAISDRVKMVGSDREVFLTGIGKPTQEALDIAHELNRIGGLDLMQMVGNSFMVFLRVNRPWHQWADARELDYAWDGIGGWLC